MTKKERQEIIEEWGEGSDKGYAIFESDNLPEGLLHIERIDDLNMFNSDFDAADQAEKDGIKLIPQSEIPNEYPINAYRYLDTPENREILNKYKKDNINSFIEEWAEEDFENGQIMDSDDFNQFKKIAKDSGYEVNEKDFEYYFECIENAREIYEEE